jgi:hypothetical protein
LIGTGHIDVDHALVHPRECDLREPRGSNEVDSRDEQDRERDDRKLRRSSQPRHSRFGITAADPPGTYRTTTSRSKITIASRSLIQTAAHLSWNVSALDSPDSVWSRTATDPCNPAGTVTRQSRSLGQRVGAGCELNVATMVPLALMNPLPVSVST